ncbi:bifunctional helix-turn-helix domain-containing protein/methylated-DNA--[protein]-cysteine S-methyltransferase [Methyloligella halotolerans]|uniref:methylated-DNA--[protein]-cysteine S-methyltransferase n=1 Tax=Methyloligella halotolerans TaxID=1177755 RepID=UPI00083E6D18
MPMVKTTPHSLTGSLSDYERVSAAVRFVTENAEEQPSLEQVARHVGLSPSHFQRLFKRWAGVSPKTFLQALTLDRAREMLRDRTSVLETAHSVGLSGGSRLHDLFVTQEAMTPGAYSRAGAGLTIAYGFHASPFGEALLMQTRHGLVGLAFCDNAAVRAETFEDMRRRWPRADYVNDQSATARTAVGLFGETSPDREPLQIVLIGTDFELRVWRQLMQVPTGEVTSYGRIAEAIGRPGAARAVGRAVGRNPLSFVVPCHRALGHGGSLTGYHWGLVRKRVLLGWEAARLAR